jgi:L-lactate dehydrogenase
MKIGIVGSGMVGSTSAFALVMNGVGRFGVDAQHVHAYVIGEHGDSEVLTWSLATIAGMPLKEFACRRLKLVLRDGY